MNLIAAPNGIRETLPHIATTPFNRNFTVNSTPVLLIFSKSPPDTITLHGAKRLKKIPPRQTSSLLHLQYDCSTHKMIAAACIKLWKLTPTSFLRHVHPVADVGNPS
jgi:hypothetical protein